MIFGSEQGRDGVAIEGIRFDCRIGVTEAERAMVQRVLVSLFFDRDLSAVGRSDNLGETVDYRAMTQEVVAIGSASKVKLLEALGSRIGRGILRRFPAVRSVRVMVRKPGTPGNVEAVAVFSTFRRAANAETARQTARPSTARRRTRSARRRK